MGHVADDKCTTLGITALLEGLWTILLTVTPGSSTEGFTRRAAGSATTLTVDDAKAISALDGIAAIEPEISTQQLVQPATLNTPTNIVGTTADFMRAPAYPLGQAPSLPGDGGNPGLRAAA